MKWKDFLDLYNPNTPGKPMHKSGYREGNGIVSTVYGLDTEKWETMYITPEDQYFCLQTYEKSEDAREGHIYWSTKVKNGFVPEGNLEDPFTFKASMKFLELVAQGKFRS